MSEELRVSRVVLTAKHRRYEFRLRRGVTVVAGPGDVGKTSLLNLIKWGLGGDAPLTPAVRTVVQQVGLQLEIGHHRLALVRGIKRQRGIVRVLNERGELVESLAVESGDDGRSTVSDYLLRALGVPTGIEVPRSRSDPRDEFTPLTFNDVFDYMYLDEVEISRSTIHHLEGYRNVKRMETFELLYRIMDTETAELKRGVATRRSERERLEVSRAAISEFLRTTGQPTQAELERQITRLTGQLAVTDREIAGLSENARAANSAGAEHRVRLVELERDKERLHAELARQRELADRYRRVRAQVLQDLERTVKALVAAPLFGALEFSLCPRCAQTLDRPVEENCCRLCGQLEKAHPDAAALAAEQSRLDAQVNETDVLITESDQAVRTLEHGVHAVDAEIRGVRELIDQLSREAVAPFLDRAAELAGIRGTLSAELRSAKTSRGHLHELERIDERIVELGGEIAELERRLRSAAAEETDTRQRIRDLSDLFAEILESFGPLWLREAHIDESTYLPIVNGSRLENLGSNMKALVNTAYFLAGLTYAVRGYPSLLPRFMMIDGPRAHRGATRVDRQAGERLYKWLMQLDQALQHQAAFLGGRGFQLLVADNDVPAFVRGLRVMRLTPEAPLLEDVPGLDDESLLERLRGTEP